MQCGSSPHGLINSDSTNISVAFLALSPSSAGILDDAVISCVAWTGLADDGRPETGRRRCLVCV